MCLFVIVLSAILALFNVSVTYDVAEPPPIEVEEEYETGSQVPDLQVPPEDYAEDDLVIRQETTEIESLLSLDGIRFLFTSLVSNFSSFSVVAVILVRCRRRFVPRNRVMGALSRKARQVAQHGRSPGSSLSVGSCPAWPLTLAT